MIPESVILELENEKVHITQERSGLSVCVKPKQVGEVNNFLMVWKEYLSFTQGDRVLRGGSGLDGVFNYNKDYPFVDAYYETINTHQAGCAILANGILSMPFCPFTVKEKNQIIMFLLGHDRGESKTGDIPDDGTKGAVHNDIDQVELNDYVESIAHLPPALQEQLIRNYCLFDGLISMDLRANEAKMIHFEKLCDKFESLLRSLCFEREGRGGDLLTKLITSGSLSEQDQRIINLIGTSSQVDVWYAAMIKKYYSFTFLPIFVRILDEAVFDVRSEPFPWVEEFCKSCDIDYNLLYTDNIYRY